MPAANTLVQSIGAQTSVNSPASVTPTLAAASTAGNLLLLSVVVTGTSPTITTPTNWTLLQSSSSATMAIALFSRPNNPGGITAVAVTVSATNGGACASLFEIGVGGVPAIDFQTASTFSSNAFGGNANSAPSALAELSIIVIGCIGGNAITITANPVGYSANTAGGSSTVATTNAQIANYLQLALGPNDIIPTGSIAGGSQSMGFIEGRFITLASTTLTHGPGEAIFVGQSLNPAGSLQTPQPIAPGNFFSGTTGSF